MRMKTTACSRSRFLHGLVVIALAISIVSCAPAAPTGEGPSPTKEVVVNGTTAKPNELPWQVALVWTGTDAPGGAALLCGGSIVGRSWILTAAHCFKDVDYRQVQVYSGSNSLSSPGIRTAIAKLTIHEEFDAETYDNDIALLELETPLDLTDPSQQAIRIALQGDEAALAQPGSLATVSGWGRISEDGPISNALLKAQVPVVEHEKCVDAYSSFFGLFGEAVTDHMLCAGFEKGGVDACQGDSGGPLVVANRDDEFIQIGIVSWGKGCAKENAYGVYTRVSYYDDWITRHCCRTGASDSDWVMETGRVASGLGDIVR